MHRIIFADKTFTGEVQGVTKYDGRECYKFTLTDPYADIIKYFIEDAQYTWEYDTVIETKVGEEIIKTPDVVQHDLTALGFTKVGKIIVSEDRNKFEVYMGKKTDAELLAEKEAEIDVLTATVAAKDAQIATLTKDTVATK